jgi:hypothetical protein
VSKLKQTNKNYAPLRNLSVLGVFAVSLNIPDTQLSLQQALVHLP